MKKNILIVEDDERIREITSDYFRVNDFNVFEAIDGEKALEIFPTVDFDLIILNIMMPNIDGWTVCRKIRSTSDVPIIILTARESEDDKLMGFELGADEYVTKPFSPKVLVARARSLLNRISSSKEADDMIDVCDIHMNKSACTVKIEGKTVELSHKEFTLLLMFLENPRIVHTRESILNTVWGYDYFGDSRVVDTHVKKLRKKLTIKSNLIKTVIRVGYKFEVN